MPEMFDILIMPYVIWIWFRSEIFFIPVLVLLHPVYKPIENVVK